jgi:DNA-binding NarL/FixJ family response regulator
MRTAVLVDRHPLWLETVETVVSRAGVTAAGKATSSIAGLELVGRLQPDLLVTGIRMPAGEISGLMLVRAALDRLPGLRVVVLTASADPADMNAAFRAGARAYVVKSAHADDMTSAVRQAFDHTIFFADRDVPGQAPVVALQKQAALTRRELEILQLAAEGHSNAELARMLWVTEQTVKFHLSNVYRKLGVSNRTEASRWAQRAGLLAAAA